jgi:hypothetical protein
MPSFRRLFLAMSLSLALGQACFAASPNGSWGGVTLERANVDDCVHLSARALEEEGFNSVQKLGDAVWATKDPHSAMVFCWAAPNLTVVITTNASSDDASRVRDQVQHRIHEVARHRGREHWR